MRSESPTAEVIHLMRQREPSKSRAHRDGRVVARPIDLRETHTTDEPRERFLMLIIIVASKHERIIIIIRVYRRAHATLP